MEDVVTVVKKNGASMCIAYWGIGLCVKLKALSC